MNEDQQPPRAYGVLMAAAAAVVILAGMRAATPILLPMLLAAFVAIITAPSLFWLQRRGLPTGVALLVVLAGLTLLVVGVITVVGGSLTGISEQLPEYQSKLEDRVRQVTTWLVEKGVVDEDASLQSLLDTSAITSMFGKLLTGLSDTFSSAFLVLLAVAFMLVEANTFPVKLRAIGGVRKSDESAAQVVADVRRYMGLKAGVSLVTGVLVAVACAILGVDFAFLWGLLAFLLNFVPTIGSILAAIPAVMVAWLQPDGGVSLAAWTGGVFLAANMVIGNVIEPRLMGRGFGMSTLVVFVSLLFWGWLLGPIGMLLSVPLSMTVRIAAEGSEDSRWLAIAMSDGAPPEPSESG